MHAHTRTSVCMYVCVSVCVCIMHFVDILIQESFMECVYLFDDDGSQVSDAT